MSAPKPLSASSGKALVEALAIELFALDQRRGADWGRWHPSVHAEYRSRARAVLRAVARAYKKALLLAGAAPNAKGGLTDTRGVVSGTSLLRRGRLGGNVRRRVIPE